MWTGGTPTDWQLPLGNSRMLLTTASQANMIGRKLMQLRCITLCYTHVANQWINRRQPIIFCYTLAQEDCTPLPATTTFVFGNHSNTP
jgi:hypothetical protein